MTTGHDSRHRAPGATAGKSMPTPSAGWTGTLVRVLFGMIFGIDAALKWLPGYRNTYVSQLKSVASGQPPWLHGWFQFWIHLQSSAPPVFATLTGISETALALCLLLGAARRATYTLGAVYTLLIWAVGEGFGGPYMPGSTDVGAGIVYALLFITLLAFAPPARRERLSLDRYLIAHWPWWRFIAEPHAVDRTQGAPRVEPVVVGEVGPQTDTAARRQQAHLSSSSRLDTRGVFAVTLVTPNPARCAAARTAERKMARRRHRRGGAGGQLRGSSL